MNVSEFTQQILNNPKVQALPVMTYPGLDLTGIKLHDVVTKAEPQAEMISALAKKYKALGSVTLMDLSVEAEAFGAKIIFPEDEIPAAIGALVTDLESAEALCVPKVVGTRCAEYVKGMQLAKEAVPDRPVFGGCIGSFSLAGRLLDINKALMATRRRPEVVHAVLKKANEFLKVYIGAIKETGIAGVVMAEPLAGLLSPASIEEFSTPYVTELVEEFQDENFGIILHNCGNTVKQIESMLKTGAFMLHIGNIVKMTDIMPQVPKHILVAGNIDPAGLFNVGTPDMVGEATAKLLDEMKDYPNFILSSGCDIPPKSPIENIDRFFAELDKFNADR